MSVSAPDPAQSARLADGRPVVGPPHRALEHQQAFADAVEALLPRAGATGQRLQTALYLVLQRHSAASVLAADGSLHLRCTECRPAERPAEQYPCPTAQHTFWALDAVLG